MSNSPFTPWQPNPLQQEGELSEVQKKLKALLEEIKLDDEDDDHGSCGSGCEHKHR